MWGIGGGGLNILFFGAEIPTKIRTVTGTGAIGRGFVQLKGTPVVTGSSVPLTGPSGPLTGPRLPLQRPF